MNGHLGQLDASIRSRALYWAEISQELYSMFTTIELGGHIRTFRAVILGRATSGGGVSLNTGENEILREGRGPAYLLIRPLLPLLPPPPPVCDSETRTVERTRATVTTAARASYKPSASASLTGA